MTWAYFFCLIAGGVLITLSIASDADANLNIEGGGISEGGNPTVLFSASFWSFGLAAFGLCGLLLQLFQGSISLPFTLPLASLLGVLMGWGSATTLRTLARRDPNTMVRSDDLIGSEATVTLPFSFDKRGFVELSVRGSLLRRVALSASRPLERGERVVILRFDGSTLIVDPLEMAD